MVNKAEQTEVVKIRLGSEDKVRLQEIAEKEFRSFAKSCMKFNKGKIMTKQEVIDELKEISASAYINWRKFGHKDFEMKFKSLFFVIRELEKHQPRDVILTLSSQIQMNASLGKLEIVEHTSWALMTLANLLSN